MLRLCSGPRAEAIRSASVKLLLDQNLSDRIISRISDLFPGSTHIKAVGLREADDGVVWEWAKQHGFTIASKDTDFHQRAIVFGQPPKVIWLRVGNCQSSLITNLLRSRYDVVGQFIQSTSLGLRHLLRERNFSSGVACGAMASGRAPAEAKTDPAVVPSKARFRARFLWFCAESIGEARVRSLRLSR